MASRQIVCVTGASGFIASWLIKMLLAKGYSVRGTLRNPDEVQKYEYLTKLEGAGERLLLCKADILHYDSLLPVIAGCHGVFHMACPITDDPEEVIDAAVKGTRNVLDACAVAGVKRCVVTSSIGAVYMNPHRDPRSIVHDDCWSDLDYCMHTKNWYCYAKTVGEQEAWKPRNVDVVVVNPSVVLGPILQSSSNASMAHVLKYLTGSAKTYANLTHAYVDVRDVAQAHILLYETPSACGRYLCAESSLHRGDLVAMLAELFPNYPLPTRCSDEKTERKKPYQFCNRKLADLGLSFTPIRTTLTDTVLSLQDKGLLSPHPLVFNRSSL